MCGIAGKIYFDPARVVSGDELRAMGETMATGAQMGKVHG